MSVGSGATTRIRRDIRVAKEELVWVGGSWTFVCGIVDNTGRVEEIGLQSETAVATEQKRQPQQKRQQLRFRENGNLTERWRGWS